MTRRGCLGLIGDSSKSEDSTSSLLIDTSHDRTLSKQQHLLAGSPFAEDDRFNLDTVLPVIEPFKSKKGTGYEPVATVYLIFQ